MHHVYTVERVARDLGVSEALIHELTLGLEPEDGVIWVYGANDDDGILAFTGGLEIAQITNFGTPPRKMKRFACTPFQSDRLSLGHASA
ncbi:hypothetical protein [Mesorhizobium sp.]|uniref:hypothetical protein n=1 Tax=Mesorhizobium sp. TaxID=1871066 RepID=UPI0025C6BC7A|nr:hypothetical protein [Mesorhizobium sp.]